MKTSYCLDDFVGNSLSAPCWVDIYSKNDKYALVAVTHFQFENNLLSSCYYAYKISKQQFEKLKNSETFDYSLLDKLSNKHLTSKEVNGFKI